MWTCPHFLLDDAKNNCKGHQINNKFFSLEHFIRMESYQGSFFCLKLKMNH